MTGDISAVEAFRDPWVFRHDGAWHMITTASARDAAPEDCGVLGHATSVDLERWETLAPLTEPGSGFAQLEVPQIVEIDGRYLLVFSCLGPELAPWRQQLFGGGGVWVASATGPLGPFDLDGARLLTDASRYAGKVVSGRDGTLLFLAFENFVGDEFIGRLADPVDFRELLGNAGFELAAAPGHR